MNKKNLGHTALVLGVLVCISKVIGFLKQIVIAWIFGSAVQTDIYFIADGFVAMICIVIFSSISVTFLSTYVYERNKNDKDTLNGLFSNMLFAGIILASVVVVIVIIFAPGISRILAPTYAGEDLKTLVGYIRVLSIVILFGGLNAIYSSVLEGEYHFIPSKLNGFFLSLTSILTCILFAKKLGIKALLFGCIGGYVFYNIFLLLNVILKAKRKLRFPFYDARVAEIFKLCIPLLIGNSIIDISFTVDKIIASSLGEGSVSALYYGQVLSMDFVNAIFITSIGAVVLTELSGFAVNGLNDRFNKAVINASKIYVVILFQISLLYYFFAEEITSVVLMHGAFDHNSVLSTAQVVRGYALGFIFLAVREVLVRAHYALKDTKWPMMNGGIGVLVNIALSFILARFLGVFGISAATSIAAMTGAFLSCITLKRKNTGIKKEKFWDKEMYGILLAGCVSAIVCFLISKLEMNYSFVKLMIGFFVSSVIYAGILFYLKNTVMLAVLKNLKGIWSSRGKKNEK